MVLSRKRQRRLVQKFHVNACSLPLNESLYRPLCRQPLELNELLVYVVYFSTYRSLISFCLSILPTVCLSQTVTSDFIWCHTVHLHVTIHRFLILLKHDQETLKCNLEYLSFHKKLPLCQTEYYAKFKIFQNLHSFKN